MEKSKPNYSFDEYLDLIEKCDSMDELRTINDLIKEDSKAKHLDASEYIDLKVHHMFKMIDLRMGEAEDKL